MRLKLFLLALAVTLFFCGTAFAAKTVPGDVIVTFYNPFPDVPVTKESLQEAGVHAEYIKNVAESLDAKVSLIYDTFSIEGNNIMALFHTNSRSETDLWFDLRMRDDVKGASLNHVTKLSKPSFRKKAR
ncbi:MAG: hypothetical protein IJ859_01510 [Synergistaceae bacterium]|nr:hypothetical protein [Synergistaceae bacterium]